MPITIELASLEELSAKMFEIVSKIEKIESELTEPRFYTTKDVANLTGWSMPTVLDLFNRADFPSCDFGQGKVVEESAFKQYFSVPRRK